MAQIKLAEHNKRNRKVTCLPIRRGVWKKNFDQQKKGLCVVAVFGVLRLGLGHCRLGAFACMASGRRSTTLRGGFRLIRGWVFTLGARGKKK